MLAQALRDLSVLLERTKEVDPAEEQRCDSSHLLNCFTKLELEELSSELAALSDEIASSHAGNATETTVYEVESFDLPGELQFSGFCLFEDMHRLQEYIVTLWQDYKEGRSDLVTASVVTNMAVELVKQIEDAIMVSFPEYVRISSYGILTLGMKYPGNSGSDHAPSGKAAPGRSVEQTELDDFLYTTTCETAMQMKYMCQLGMEYSMPIASVRADFIKTPDLLKLPWYEQMESDHERLARMLQESFLKLEAMDDDEGNTNPTMDAFTKAAQDILFGDTFGARAVFACRLLMDIQDCLGEKLSSGWQHLQSESLQFLEDTCRLNHLSQRLIMLVKEAQRPHIGQEKETLLKDYIVVEGNADAKQWPRGAQCAIYDRLLMQAINLDSFVSNETKMIMHTLYQSGSKEYGHPGHPMRRSLPSAAAVPDDVQATMQSLRVFDSIPPATDPVYAYSHNPIACGTLLFDLEVGMEEACVSFRNYHHTVIIMAHLYNALLQSGLLEMRFAELDSLIDTRCLDIFGSTPPTTCEQSFKRLALKVGVSPTMFARNSRIEHNAPINQKVLKDFGLKHDPMGSIFRNAGQGKAAGTMLYDLEKMMKSFESNSKGRRTGSDTHNPEEQLSTLRHMTRFQFLDNLRSCLPSMRCTMLHADAIRLTTQCNDILDNVRERIARECGVNYDSADPTKGHGHDFIPIAVDILIEATQHEETQATVDRARNRNKASKGGPQLWIVAEVIKEHLAE